MTHRVDYFVMVGWVVGGGGNERGGGGGGGSKQTNKQKAAGVSLAGHCEEGAELADPALEVKYMSMSLVSLVALFWL